MGSWSLRSVESELDSSASSDSSEESAERTWGSVVRVEGDGRCCFCCGAEGVRGGGGNSAVPFICICTAMVCSSASLVEMAIAAAVVYLWFVVHKTRTPG